MSTHWQKLISRFTPSQGLDDPKLDVAKDFGREAARLLYPRMQWDEAQLALATVWDQKDRIPWREVKPAVHAAWMLAKAEIDVASRRELKRRPAD